MINNNGNYNNVKGIVRSIDGLGRITLPKEFRITYDMMEMDSVEIIGTTDGILLRKNNAADTCVFCKSKTDNKYKDKCICEDCMMELKK